MPSTSDRYWFPAKRYGWGWGVPATWQGWAVLVGYVVLMTIAAVATSGKWGLYAVLMFVLTVGFIAICWWKGEPPNGRWGGER